MEQAKIERKLFAHYIDSAIPGASETKYVRLGDDLEELDISMNANVETKNNICGETSVVIGSYQPQAEVDTYYAEKGSPLSERLQQIIDERLVLDDLKTTIVEVHVYEPDSQGSGQYVAYKEDAIIEVKSYGGNNTGYQIPFAYHCTGNRVKGVFNPTTKMFTAEDA